MDSLVGFSPVDTSKFVLDSFESLLIITAYSDDCIAGFININAIRLKKYGLQKKEEGNSLAIG